MKVTQSEFIISAVGPSQYPTTGLPELALAGRSNVGKSSFINRLIQRKISHAHPVNREKHKPSITMKSITYFISSMFPDMAMPKFPRRTVKNGGK